MANHTSNGSSLTQRTKQVISSPTIRSSALSSARGQVYVALLKHRQETEDRTTAITRIEQLHPFPWAQVKENLDSYPNAENIVWAQEEPLNAGAWSFTQPRLETLLNETEFHNRRHVMYAGRNPSASVATGMKSVHQREEKSLLEVAFSVKQDKLKGE